MKRKYEKILSAYEDFKWHYGNLSSETGFFEYCSPSSIHSDVTSYAYGIRETQTCCSIQKANCVSYIDICKKDLNRRFYLKLKACLFDWKTYICGIEIKANGKVFYVNDREFFDNTNLSWPTTFIPIENSFLKEGRNVIEISQRSGESYLLVSKMDIISLPEIKFAQQLTLRTAARLEEEFALAFNAHKDDVSILMSKDCEVSEIITSPLNENQTILKIKATDFNPQLKLKIGAKTVKATLPEIAKKSDDCCIVGIDSDDHKHDDTDEANRIIEIFCNTGMGEFFQVRPHFTRNFLDFSPREVWEKRIQFLKSFGAKISQADDERYIPYLSEIAGENFYGEHFHEAYLYFCSALEKDPVYAKVLFLDIEKMRAVESFEEAKNLFCEAVKNMYNSCSSKAGLTSVGSPSLLCGYEITSGFERVTMEPVSNINILAGAVRGANPRKWGAHIPTDWYFGEPQDLTKCKKALLAMQLLYLNGADYVYAENSVFETNAYERCDWDDNFCIINRELLREFYDYTIKNPREGKLKTDLAVIYGNNEYILWHHDDRIAEMPENDDWDITLWGKWKDNRHHKLWRAVDAWLPLAENQNTRENPLNLKLFSGTPYGNVDVIPYEKALEDYKSVALLGWNTYREGFLEKIYNYVNNGGNAFISYVHLNETDRPDREMIYADNSESKKLLGETEKEFVLISGEAVLEGGKRVEIGEEIKVAKFKMEGAEKLVTLKDGTALVYKKKIGKGTLYFGTFADYNSPDGKLEIMKYVLQKMGEASADIVCNNPNISFTVREKDDGSVVVDALNLSANSDKKQKFELSFSDGAKIKDSIKPCEIKTYTLK